MESSAANSFYCPLCHSIDAVTKVSSIVDGGSTTSIGYHAAGRLSGTSVTKSTTALADKLAPPSLPRLRLAADGYNGCAVSVLIFFGLCAAFIAWLVRISTIPSSMNEFPLNLVFVFLVFLSLGFILGPFIAFLIVAYKRNKKRPSWEKAIAMWEQLYYCARNDVVFLPGASQHCASTSQISTLLYPSQV